MILFYTLSYFTSPFSGVQNVASLPFLAFGGAACGALGLTCAVNVITTMDMTSPTPSYEEYHPEILENKLESAQMLIAHRPWVASEELRLSVVRTGDGVIRMADLVVLEQLVRWSTRQKAAR